VVGEVDGRIEELLLSELEDPRGFSEVEYIPLRESTFWELCTMLGAGGQLLLILPRPF
jgi:hypothetical protein